MAKKKDEKKPKQTPEQRNANLKPWKPGQSGNPKGRPKKLPSLDVVLRNALGGYDPDGEDSPLKKIIENLINQASDKYNPHASKNATLLIERAFGKTPIVIQDETKRAEQISGFNIKLKKDGDDKGSSGG